MRRPLLLVLLLTLLTCAPGIWWGLPVPVNEETNAPWELDGVAPIAPLTEAYYRFTREGNAWLTYPLFHFVVLTAAYTPYVGVQYALGHLHPASTFPYGMSDIVGMSQTLTLIARSVSLVMALLTVWLVWKTAKELFGARVAVWAGVLVALLAPFTYYAKTSNLDVPYLCWTWAAIYAYVRALRTNERKYHLILGVTAALAIATKDQAYGFFLLPPIAVVYAVAWHRTGGRVTAGALLQALVSREILTAAAATIVTFVLANNLILGWHGFMRHVQYILAGGSQPWRMFERNAWGEVLLARLSFVLLGQSIGWGSVVLAMLGLVWTATGPKRNAIALSLLLFVVSYAIFFLGVVLYAYPRFMLGPASILLLFTAVALDRLTQMRAPAMRAVAVLAVILSVGWQAVLTANMTVSLVADSRVAAERWIRQHVPRGATLESPIVREALLPHLSGDYKISLKGSGDFDPAYDELTGEALQARRPDYLLLVSLGMSADHDTWSDPRLVAYRDALLAGQYGYKVVAEFDTPHVVPYRQLTGTRPRVVILARDR